MPWPQNHPSPLEITREREINLKLESSKRAKLADKNHKKIKKEAVVMVNKSLQMSKHDGLKESLKESGLKTAEKYKGGISTLFCFAFKSMTQWPLMHKLSCKVWIHSNGPKTRSCRCCYRHQRASVNVMNNHQCWNFERNFFPVLSRWKRMRF